VSPVAGVRLLLYGLALPAAALAAYERRHAQHADDASHEPVTGDDAATPTPPRPRLRRRKLRALAAQGGDLRAYDLTRASLGGLDLAEVDLADVDLSGATLRKSSLRDARLTDSVLDYADLSACDLRSADLSGASLLETDLAGADLRGVDLSGCHHLTMANLRGARFDRDTHWPAALDPLASGAVRAQR
jgi:hypothetical protein